MFNRFFPRAFIVLHEFKLFVVVDNYYFVAFPEMGIPASQDVVLQGVNLFSGTLQLVAMPSPYISLIVDWHVIFGNLHLGNGTLVDDCRVAQSLSNNPTYPIFHSASPLSKIRSAWVSQLGFSCALALHLKSK